MGGEAIERISNQAGQAVFLGDCAQSEAGF
jgi:hypothetical protein